MLWRHEIDLTPFRNVYSEFVGKAVHSVCMTVRVIENQAYQFIIDTVENMEPDKGFVKKKSPDVVKVVFVAK